LKARCYVGMRRLPGVKGILEEENRAARALLDKVPEDQLLRIFDLATGRGNGLQLVSEYYSHKFALDNSLAMLRKTREYFHKPTFIQADMLHIPARSQICDLVLCIGLSELVAEFDSLLIEIARILCPGGFLLLTTAPPSAINIFRNLLGYRVYPRDKTSVERVVHQCGYLICDHRKTLIQEQFLLKKRESSMAEENEG